MGIRRRAPKVGALAVVASLTVVAALACFACSDDPDDASDASARDAGPRVPDAVANTPPSAYDSGTGGGADAAADADAASVEDAGADAGPPPPAPTGLSTAFGNEGVMFASWTPLDDPDVVSYTLLYGTSEDNLDRETTVDAPATLTQVPVVNGVTYYFAVRATYAGGRVSDPSAIVSARTSGFSESHPAQPGVHYLIRGGDMGSLFQHLNVTAIDGESETPIDDATVTVNGVGLAVVGSGNGRYSGVLPAAVPSGGAINLSVTAGGNVVTGAASVPEAPAITAPAAAAVLSRAQAFTIAWTTPADPDRFWVLVECPTGTMSVNLPGSARSAVFAGQALPSNDSCNIDVMAYAHGTFSGPARHGSRMNVRTSSTGPVAITTGP